MSKKLHLFTLTVLSSLLVCGPSLKAEPPAPTKEAPKPQTAGTPEATPAPMTKEELSKISEAFGNFIGRNLKNTGIEFDLDAVVKGIKDGASGKPSPMTDAEYERKMISLQEKAFQKLSTENLKTADNFMVTNAKAQGVKELEPGKLQIMIIKEGTGPEVTENSTPQINYVGKYIDGTVFGNSEDAGGPITIPLDQTIPGFSKGLLGMKEGEKRRIFVHPDLGYGTTGHLAPNSLLIFDVEVVKASAPAKKENDKTDASSMNEEENEDDEFADEDMMDDESEEEEVKKPNSSNTSRKS